MNQSGIRGLALDWINSYLSKRQMKVKVSNSFSDKFSVELGVPQGSVLGPLLFLIAINDLPNFLSDGSLVLFADDASIALASDTSEGLLGAVNQTITEMSNWCEMNRLILNNDKTSVVYFHKKRILPIDDLFVPSTKVLGIFMDDDLTFESQIQYLAKKLNSAYYAILQLKSTLDIRSLINVYYAMVYSIISYNIIIWGQAVNWHRIFIAQKRIIRLIFNIKHRDS